MNKAALLIAVLLVGACSGSTGVGNANSNSTPENAAPAGNEAPAASDEPAGESLTPEELARKFMDATLAQDTDAAVSLMRKEEREEQNVSYNLNNKGLMESYSLGDATIEGESASIPVAVTFKNDKPAETIQLKMVREEGEWRINFWETLQQLMGSGKPD